MTRLIAKRSTLACALALALPPLALAEETVVVTAAPVESAVAPTKGYTAKTSRGSTKTDEPLITTAQSVSVVTRQQMDDQGANTISQALNYTPGVYVLTPYHCAASTAATWITCSSTACA